jgi:predicted acyl esterase
MLQIQSSWFPLVDRNPQTFVNIHKASPEDFVTARQRVYRDETHATRIRMPVVP